MRKSPQQERSRQMVQRIVDAARDVLITDGYEHFTTNRVAARAGVSPGSLYQYFPDKQSLLDEVIDRYWERLAGEVESSLSDRFDRFDAGNARAIFDALLTALETDSELLRVIFEELPKARMQQQLAITQRRIQELAATLMILRGDATDHDSALTKSWVAVIAIENLAARWVLDDTSIPRDQLLDEIVELIVVYLGAEPAQQA